VVVLSIAMVSSNTKLQKKNILTEKQLNIDLTYSIKDIASAEK